MAVLRLSGKTPNEMFLAPTLHQRGFPSSNYDDAGARQPGVRVCTSTRPKVGAI